MTEMSEYNLGFCGLLEEWVEMLVCWIVEGEVWFFFFFQAEDGIRDLTVTGVQTCALPIFGSPGNAAYTFRRNSSGNWVQAQKLVPAVPADGFGTAVAIDRDMILVGAPSVDLEGGDRGSLTPDFDIAGGAVFGFLPGASGCIESFKLRVFTYTRNGSGVLARGITSRQGPVTGMGLSNNALLTGAFIDQLSCRFVCVRIAHLRRQPIRAVRSAWANRRS